MFLQLLDSCRTKRTIFEFSQFETENIVSSNFNFLVQSIYCGFHVRIFHWNILVKIKSTKHSNQYLEILQILFNYTTYAFFSLKDCKKKQTHKYVETMNTKNVTRTSWTPNQHWIEISRIFRIIIQNVVYVSLHSVIAIIPFCFCRHNFFEIQFLHVTCVSMEQVED